MTYSRQEFRERSIDYLYGELEPGPRARFEATLAESQECRRELAALRNTLRMSREGLALLEEEPPARVSRALHAAHAAELAHKAGTRAPSARRKANAAGLFSFLFEPRVIAALGVAAVAMLGWLVKERSDTPSYVPARPHPGAVQAPAPASRETSAEKVAAPQVQPAPAVPPASHETQGERLEAPPQVQPTPVVPPAPASHETPGERLDAPQIQRAPGEPSAVRPPPEQESAAQPTGSVAPVPAKKTESTGKAKSAASRGAREEVAAPRQPASRALGAANERAPQAEPGAASPAAEKSVERAQPASRSSTVDEGARLAEPAPAPSSADDDAPGPGMEVAPAPSSAKDEALSPRAAPAPSGAAREARRVRSAQKPSQGGSVKGAAPESTRIDHAADAALEVAQAHAAAGRSAEAAAAYQQLLQRFPHDARVLEWQKQLQQLRARATP